MSNLIEKQAAIESVGLNTWAGSKISQLPTVDAIPIEWIEMWGRPHTMDYWSEDGYLSVEHDGYYTIDNMLKDWEKENEQIGFNN